MIVEYDSDGPLVWTSFIVDDFGNELSWFNGDFDDLGVYIFLNESDLEP